MGMNLNLSSWAFGYQVLILVLLCICHCNNAQTKTFNILQFGAVGTGKVDSTQALSNAWNQACSSGGSSVVLIPKGTFLILPLILEGPCKGPIQIQLDGVLLASTDKALASKDHWLAIHQVTNLLIDGTGTLDGQGASTWSLNPCDLGGSCPSFPVTLRFESVTSATVRNIKSMNSKFFHFALLKSKTITFDHVTIVAPDNSPNTDGIHIGSQSSDVNIINSNIGTGDDCISIGPGVSTVNITGVQCGPGHGISIGSLGKNPNEGNVVGITVQSSSFSNTQNGVRIKTWSNSNPGLVSNVAFKHLQMNNVENPIIIDQNYCPHGVCTKTATSQSRVQIEDVRFEDIRGSSKTKVAVKLECSQTNPCQSVILQDINLGFNGGGGSSSDCSNVKGSASGTQVPPSCL